MKDMFDPEIYMAEYETRDLSTGVNAVNCGRWTPSTYTALKNPFFFVFYPHYYPSIYAINIISFWYHSVNQNKLINWKPQNTFNSIFYVRYRDILHNSRRIEILENSANNVLKENYHYWIVKNYNASGVCGTFS